MSKKPIGRVVCPHCKQSAAVYENARSRGGDLGGKLYYRCGEFVARGVSSGCGTVQIYGASGQAWLRENLEIEREPVPLTSVATVAAVEAREPERVVEAEPDVIELGVLKGGEVVTEEKITQLVSAKGSQAKKSGGIFNNFLSSLTGEI